MSSRIFETGLIDVDSVWSILDPREETKLENAGQQTKHNNDLHCWECGEIDHLSEVRVTYFAHMCKERQLQCRKISHLLEYSCIRLSHFMANLTVHQCQKIWNFL